MHDLPPVAGRQARTCDQARDRRARAGAAPGPRSQSGSLFGSLFSSKPAETKTAEKREDRPILDRMATHGRARANPTPPAAEARSQAPKPKPAAEPTRTASHGAIQPKPAEPKPAEPKTAEATPPKPAAAPAARAATAMSGSAPVVPAGTFDSRWWRLALKSSRCPKRKSPGLARRFCFRAPCGTTRNGRGSACISCLSRTGRPRCGRPCPRSTDRSDCARRRASA